MNKKTWIILAIVVLVLLAVVLCLLFLQPEKEPEPNKTPVNYSTAATNYGLRKEKISSNEILLAETVTKLENGDTQVVYRVYTVAEGYAPSYFMGMSVEEAQANPGLALVGSAKASFLKGSLDGIYGFTISHDR